MITPSHKSFFNIDYRSDDITKNFFFFFFFCISAFWIPSVEHDENIHSPNLVGISSWEPEIWPHEYVISPIEISINWPGTLVSVGLLGIHAAIYQATMNQFMSNLVCEGFHHVLLKYGHENAEMQKENLVTSHFSTLL